MFNVTSYVAYPTISDALMELTAKMTFKAHGLDNAVLLYDASGSDGNSDYVAIVIKEGYIVFQFDTGSGK